MSDNAVASGRVVAVLLADGWHRIVPGSFSIGPTGLSTGADPEVPGFRFEEAAVGSPYRPTALLGPLGSIIAVRRVTSASQCVGDLDRARAAHNGHLLDQGALR